MTLSGLHASIISQGAFSQRAIQSEGHFQSEGHSLSVRGASELKSVAMKQFQFHLFMKDMQESTTCVANRLLQGQHAHASGSSVSATLVEAVTR